MEIAGLHINISLFVWYTFAIVMCFIIYQVVKKFGYSIIKDRPEATEDWSRTIKIVRFFLIGFWVIAIPAMTFFFSTSLTSDGHDRIKSATPDINYAQPTTEEIAEENQSYESEQYKKLKEETEIRTKKAEDSYEQAVKKALEDSKQN